MDPMRTTAPRTVLTDGPFTVTWTGSHFEVEIGNHMVWTHRVCATDSNVEEVAHAWWVDHLGKRFSERVAADEGLYMLP